MAKLDHSALKEVLDYDPVTGIFTWKVHRHSHGGGVKPGDVAGCIDPRGYRRIGVLGWNGLAHRLAWFYVKGVWPEAGLDHRDRNHDHNAIENLRECDQSRNLQNTSLDGQGSNKFRGVYYDRQRNKWRVQIIVYKKTIYVGQFDSEGEAAAAYLSAKIKHHPFYAGASA